MWVSLKLSHLQHTLLKPTRDHLATCNVIYTSMEQQQLDTYLLRELEQLKKQKKIQSWQFMETKKIQWQGILSSETLSSYKYQKGRLVCIKQSQTMSSN